MASEIINSKREAHKQELREQLLEQGFLLFSEKGLEQTTVADIVEKCNIARGTFYNYFSDINALFDALIESLNSRIREGVKKTRKENWYSEDMFVRFIPLHTSGTINGANPFRSS